MPANATSVEQDPEHGGGADVPKPPATTCSDLLEQRATLREQTRVRCADGPHSGRSLEHDGLAIVALDWGGDGPPLLLQHPNGFCAGVFDPLARRSAAEYRPIAVDVRGHGASERPASLDDVHVHQRGARRVGGARRARASTRWSRSVTRSVVALVVILDALRPGVVRKALLCEAIVFALPGQVPGVPSPAGPGGPNPMAALARKRRAVWPDRDTAVGVVRRAGRRSI